VQLFELSAAELAGIGVLLALNPSNSRYGVPPVEGVSEYVNALPAIEAAVNNGLVLVFADRRVTEAAANIPGASLITFVRDPVVGGGEGPLGPSADINIFDNSTLVTFGPGGTVTNTNLDDGNFSNHGFAARATLPAGSRTILVRTSDAEAVTFSYPLGLGAVVYTTVPLDAYLAGGIFGPPSAAFKNIYGPNLIAYGASLAESSTLGPISLRYCHSAAHFGDPACTRVVGGQTVPTTGKVASQDLPDSACPPGQPTRGTASARVTPGDKVTVSWTDLNCGSNDGSESIRVNPINTDVVGTDVKLRADAPGDANVRLRVVPRDAEYDDYCEDEERPRRPQRIVVETLKDGKKLEKWTINGDERIGIRLANTVPDDVITNAVVKFWVGRRATGPKTIIAKAFRNGEPVGVDTRVLSAVPRTTFSEVQVYTPANFGNNAFDRLELRAAHGSYFGIGSIDLNTTHPASP